MSLPTAKPPRVALALQGGGAHGALTWGVIDALLESGAIEISAASGASAGAINAVVLAHGLMAGGADEARRHLASFWQQLARKIVVDPVYVASGDDVPKVAGWFRTMLWWSRWAPLSHHGGMGSDPLASILRDHVDFDALRRHCPVRLFLAATHAVGAQLRIFREHELSLDAVLASACLPPWRPTPVIDGQPYWDGGFTANPPLLPLARDGQAQDVLLVLLMTSLREALPRTVRETEGRVAELAFLSPLVGEWRMLLEMQSDWRRWAWLPGRPAWVRTRWHAIDAGPALARMPPETRLVPSARLLELLHEMGRVQALRWLERHAGDLGRRSTASADSLAS